MTNGFKCSDVHNFEKLNNLSINTFEFNFCQDKDKWKHNLIPIDISKNDSDRVIDLLIYKNHYALIIKKYVFLVNRNKSFACRRCLHSHTNEYVSMNQKGICGDYDICSISSSSESQLHWIDQFHKSPLYLGIIADFEDDIEIDNSNIRNKTTNIFKQNPMCIDYHIKSEVGDVLKSCYFNSTLDYDNEDWFVIEVIKLEIRKVFYFKKTMKAIILSEEGVEVYKNNNICRFCEKQTFSHKVRDHCHLTGNYRGPAHEDCSINLTQKRSIFFP